MVYHDFRQRCQDGIWQVMHDWADQAYTGDLVTWVWALRPRRNVRLDSVVLGMPAVCAKSDTHHSCAARAARRRVRG